VTWQIVPTALGEMLQDKDAKKSTRVMQAMMQIENSTSPVSSARTRGNK
jgi:predicted 3-demethylubiquinone-9 3-methyltransferase (glyoxalase superfamily)